jgi:hypothetical protein
METPVSDTPRTDVQITVHDEASVGGTAGYNDLLEHARQLERELAEHYPKPCCEDFTSCKERCIPLVLALRARAERAESDREQLRAATIEECAKVCEYHADGYDESRMADPANTKRAAIYMNQASTARVIADAIRALSEPQAKEGEHADTLPDRGDVLRSWDAAMNKEGKHDA